MALKPTVAEIMTPDPSVLSPDDTVAIAAHEMDLCSIRHLPVVDRQRRLVGLVSQRDVLAHSKGNALLRDVMSEDVLTVDPETPAHEAAYLLLHHKIGCLPVVDREGRLAGIITEADFVRVAHDLLGGVVSTDELESEEREADRV